MKGLLVAVTALVTSVPMDKVAAVAAAVRNTKAGKAKIELSGITATPLGTTLVTHLMEAWQSTAVGPDELAAMLLAASAVANDVASRQSTELVWTGPTTPYVSARRTEQALLQVIDTANRELFICSFVAYQVTTIVKALNDAIGQAVRVSILLESSIVHGGSTSTDSIGSMRALVPDAALLVWANQTEPYIGGRVHAKVAVADRTACFITSANLTTYAMERNMEAGILLTGGDIPGMLHDHLYGLVSTKVLVSA